MQTIRIYLALFATSIKARMEYKTSFLFYIVAILTFYIGQMGLLFVLLNRFHHIKGWTIGEMAFLYSLQAFAYGFTNLIFSQLIHFDQMVVDGEFDRALVRPLSPLGQVIFSKFEVSTVAHLIIGFIALYLGSHLAGIVWTLNKILIFPVVVVGGVLIAGAIRLTVTAVAFWTLRNQSLVHTVIFSSKEFIVYPVTIYNRGMQVFLTFLFPIAFINFYPAHLFLSRSGEGLLHPALEMGTPLVGSIMFAVSLFMWKAGVNHYQSTGS
ncbi:MAG: ABC-2 family transporter protein [Candidatus Brocadiaceae bacterium]|nr:ABC-2 family transporter protein [Candidatus Brocadiaceae bacterium]